MDNGKTKTKITLIVDAGSDLEAAIDKAVAEIGLSRPEIARLGTVKALNEFFQTGSITAPRLMPVQRTALPA